MLRDAIVVGCYLFSLSMAVIIIPYHKVTVHSEGEATELYVWHAGRRDCQGLPSGVISEVGKNSR